jgi:hypothetical protein
MAVLAVLTEYKKDRDKRDREQLRNMVIIALCIVGIFATILITMVKTNFKTDDEIIFQNLKSCPKSSVVDYREGEPFTVYKNKRVYLLKEGCKK